MSNLVAIRPICAVALLLLAGAAQAATISVGFTASVSEVYDETGTLSALIAIGDPVSGTFVYDTDAPPDPGFPPVDTAAIYISDAPPSGATLQVGPLLVTASGTSIYLANESQLYGGPPDVFSIGSLTSLEMLTEGVSVSLDLRSSSSQTLTRVTPLFEIPPLEAWDARAEFWLGTPFDVISRHQSVRIRATLTSLSSVPEPGTLPLLATALAVLAAARRATQAARGRAS